MMEGAGAIFGALALAWGFYVIYAVMTVVRHIKIISYEARRTADAVSRVEDMLIEEFAE
jgi:hypothetical protein